MKTLTLLRKGFLHPVIAANMLVAVGARMDNIFGAVNTERNQTATHEKAEKRKLKKKKKKEEINKCSFIFF